MKKVLFTILMIAMVIGVGGCEVYKTLYGADQNQQNGVRIIEFQSGPIDVILICEDRIVCYESSHSYGVGLSCFEMDELGSRSDKYTEKCNEVE